MARITGWKRQKSSYPQWKNDRTGKQIWVYPHKSWDVNPKTGNTQNHRITHYSIRHFVSKSTRTAKSLNGKKFRTKASATKYARSWMRKRPRG